MLSDLKLAVNQKLKAAYPAIVIQSKDIKEGFDRPCFYVEISNNSKEIISPEFNNRLITFTIYYFASDRYKHSLENLEVQETLEDIFLGKLNVNGKNVLIHEVRSYIVDGVLQVKFDIDINTFIEETSDHELTEVLVTNIKED
jgi:hypothetical protein